MDPVQLRDIVQEFSYIYNVMNVVKVAQCPSSFL